MYVLRCGSNLSNSWSCYQERILSSSCSCSLQHSWCIRAHIRPSLLCIHQCLEQEKRGGCCIRLLNVLLKTVFAPPLHVVPIHPLLHAQRPGGIQAPCSSLQGGSHTNSVSPGSSIISRYSSSVHENRTQ